jgi:hypothetical protein
VAGIEHDGNLGIGCGVLELSNRALELQVAYVIGADNGIAALLKTGSNGLRVSLRIGKRRRVLIGGISDHQRDPPIGEGQIGAQGRQKNPTGDSGCEEPVHP